MTKALSADMQSHVVGGAVTLAWALKITRADGTVYAFTSHDANAVIDGVTYLSAPGLDVASFVSSSGLAVGNNEITALEDDNYFTRLDVLAGKWDGAKYAAFQYNFKSIADGKINWPYGRLGNITPEYGSFKIELRDYRQALQQDTTRIFQEQCPYDLGDTFCTVSLAPLTVTGSATSVESQSQFTDTTRTEAADWFGYGKLTWTSGENSGVSVKVRVFVGGQFTLAEPMVYPVTVGDTYSAIAGCRHRWIEDCRDKFDNVLNFGGDPAKPTGDEVVNPPSETPLAIPPAPAPAPAPATPTPGSYNAAERVVALDYTQTYDAGNISDLSRYALVIRGMTTAKAASIGSSYGAGVTASGGKLAQYGKINELKTPQSSSDDEYALYTEVNARGWWVLSQPSGVHVQSSALYGSDEVNVTTAVTANGSGQKWPQYRAAWDFSQRIDDIPDATYVFIDNVWSEPRVTADYNVTGTANQSPSAVASAFRSGYVAYAAALKTHRVGLKVIVNADNDLSSAEYAGVFDAAFNEGCVGRTYGTFATGGITAVRTRQLSHIANTIDGVAILQTYAESTDYKTFRLGFTMAKMFDSWFCPTDSTPSLHAVWLEEFEQALGVRTDSIPTAAWSNGVWACRFETGLVLCNPTSSAATVDPTTLGAYKRFIGTQDATTNSGATVSGSISIPAHDGLVLIDA